MKPQLLEDIGESHTALDLRCDLPPSGILQSILRKPAPPPLPRSHFGVWRDRIVTEAPLDETAYQAPVEDEARVEPVQESYFDNHVEHTMEPIAEAEIIIPPREDLFYERAAVPAAKLGRAAGWTAALVALALVCGGSLWFYKDRKDAGSLALVADQVKAAPALVQAAPAPLPAPVSLSPAARAQERIPPLVLLAPEEAKPAEPESVAEVEVPVKAAVEKPVPVLKKEPVKVRPPVRTVRKTVAARPEPRPLSVKAERPLSESPALAFSKACRALGYQDSQCRKRACVLTKFGLACKG